MKRVLFLMLCVVSQWPNQGQAQEAKPYAEAIERVKEALSYSQLVAAAPLTKPGIMERIIKCLADGTPMNPSDAKILDNVAQSGFFREVFNNHTKIIPALPADAQRFVKIIVSKL